MGRDVRAEQIRTLYGQSAPLLAGNVANGLIVATVLWPTQDRSVIGVWFATVALVTAARGALWRAFLALAPGTDELSAWGLRYAVSVAISGGAWGSTALLFLDLNRPLSVALIGFLIGGMGAAAAGTLACYTPAFLAYSVPLLVPLAYRTLVSSEPALRGMGVLVVVYAVTLTVVARITNRSVRRSLELRFENDALVTRLSNAQLDLEQNNQVLEERVQERARQIEQQGEALRRAQRLEAIGRLAGGIAHDFNNLLTVVLSNTSSLLAEPQKGQRERAIVEEIQVAGQRGADLVKQLLSFSGKQPDEKRVFDVNQVVRETERLIRRLIGEMITVRATLAPEPLPVLIGPGQLQEILMNLATNARDAMPDGGTLTIRTATATEPPSNGGEPGPCVLLEMTDTGVGMEAEVAGRAFDPFFTTKPQGKGTGLGLASVFGIVQQAGGRIELASIPGRGSHFTLVLPRAQAAPQPPEPRPESRPPSLAPGRRVTVLVAEDERDVRAVVARVLRRAGHEVLTAEDGVAALEVAKAHPGAIDVLVTDVVMGRMGGPELARRLRAERPEVGVVFMSGHVADDAPPPHDLSHGVLHLDKPFQPQDLVARVETLLERTAEPERSS